MDEKLTIGVDLGGTNLRVGVVDSEGEILEEYHERTEAYKGSEDVINQMVEMIQELREHYFIKHVGIGSPGPLDPYQGLILSPPNLPGWNQVPIVSKVQQEIGVPVHLDNDANAATLAEAKIGAGRQHTSVFYMTVSTGIGGGYVLNGQIVKGEQGYAGEIGNMILKPDGPRWSNLNAGSLESLASGTSIGREGKERLGIEGGAKEVFLLAKEGNEAAKAIVDETLKSLAMGIANVTHIVNPAIFVLGGGVMQAEEQILTPLRKKVGEYLYPQLKGSCRIEAARLGTKAGLIGAAMLGSNFR